MLKHIPFYASLLGRDLKGTKAQQAHVLLYGAIEAHSLGDKGCIASNQTLAKEIGCTVGTVRNTLSELKQAGWVFVEYNDENIRIRIHPLMEINPPSPTGDTPVTHRLHPRHPQVTIDNSREDTLDSSSQSSEEGEWSTVECDDWGEELPPVRKKKNSPDVLAVYDLFGKYPKAWLRYAWARDSAEALLRERGMEQIKYAVRFAQKHQHEKFCPKISTPRDLEEKWDKLLDYQDRQYE